MEKIFSGKKALVIGGTGGIGRAVALRLAERGAEMIVHGGSSKERLESTLKAIKDIHGKGDGFLLPITKPEAAREIMERAGNPDILVCAWGPFRRDAIENLDCGFWQSMAAGNLVFPGYAASLVLPWMMKRKWGRILFFGGTNTDTIRGYITTAAYSAAKTALGVVAKSAARSAGEGITCNVICPGLTDTEYLDENGLQYNKEKTPWGEPLKPDAIACVCMDILANPAINGAIIPVDGGLCL